MKAHVNVALATLAAMALLACGLTATAEGPSTGQPAPEIKAEGWLNSEKPVTLAGLRGKIVVVEFWATWCPPCRRSIPHLIQLHEKRAKEGLVIVGLSDEAKDAVEPFAKKMAIPYVVGYGSPTGADYGVSGIPTAFVVGTDGKVIWSGHPLDEEFEAAIDKALTKPKKPS